MNMMKYSDAQFYGYNISKFEFEFYLAKSFL